MLFALCLALTVTMMSDGKPGGPAASPAAIVPDKKFQEQIKRYVFAKTEEQFTTEFQKLKELDREPYRRLIPQFVWFVANVREDEHEHAKISAYTSLGLIVKDLEIRSDQLLSAVLPYLGTKDENLREVLRRVMGWVQGLSPLDGPNLGTIRTFLSNDPDDANSRSLIQYMYSAVLAEEVFKELISKYAKRGEPKKSLFWAEHLIADVIWKQEHGFLDEKKPEPEAMKQLEMLSRHEAWWVRIYVCEIIRQHPQLHNEEIMDRLAKDKHPLVQESVRRYAEEGR